MEIWKSLTVLSAILTVSVQIYVPDEGINQKPVAYSQGIKTSNYRRPNQIQVDHNYSKVYSHNNRSISSDSDDDDSRRLYPIYNAHTYGARPDSGQVYVINGTRIARRSNPIRQIVAYNKEKRSPKIQIYRSCPKNATGQYVYEASCNQFLNCWKGRGHIQNCAPGTLFNPKTLECDFPEKVTCVSGPREDILPKERSANLQQIGCPRDFSGLIPNYTDCSKFINCVSGIENLMDCPTGTLFDVNKNICDFAHKATCFNGQNENLKVDVDNKLDFGTSERKAQLRFKFGEARCPRDVQGLMRHPTDCAKFLNCANGETFVQVCAPGTLFNPTVKICDFPYNVRCDSGPGFEDENRNYGYHHGTSSNQHGTGWRNNTGYRDDTYGTRGYNADNFGQGGTNSYNQGTSDTHYANSGQRAGTQNVYNGGQAPSFSGTSDNRYENPNYAKGNIGTTYHQNPRSDPNEDNVYNTDRSTYGYRDSDYRPGGTSSLHQPTISQDQASQYPSSQNPDIYIQGPGQYHRPYSTSSSHQNPDSYQVKGHYITRPAGLGNQYSKGENSWSASKAPYGSDNQHGTYDQSSWSGGATQNANQYENARSGNSHSLSNTHDYDGTTYGTGSSNRNSWSGSTLQNGNQYENAHSGNSHSLSNTQDYDGATYGTKNPNRNSWSGSTIRDGNQYENLGSSSNTQDYDRATYGTNSNNRNSLSGTSNFDRNANTGGTYAQYPNSESHGTGQHSWTGNNGQTYGDSFSQNSRPGANRNTHVTKGTGGTYGNSWPETRNEEQNRNIHGLTGQNTYGTSYGHDSLSGTRDQNTYGTQESGGQNSWSGNPTFEGNTNHLTNQKLPDVTYGTTANYDQVVHIGHHRPTKVPFRNSYEPFYGTTPRDYDDYRPNHSPKYVRSTTPRILEKSWPPSFPSTDVNADYVFEYEDPDVNPEAENPKNGACPKTDFLCPNKKCISKTVVCNGAKDCPDGKDEENCLQYVSKFEVQKNKKLAILERERWDNVSIAACALMCVKNQKFKCRSFNYRKVDKTCFLSSTNEGLTGAIISYYPFDYYEFVSERINCTTKFTCPNRKCIEKTRVCDGQDDCGDRTDEKNCRAQDFGYSIRLTGNGSRNEGSIEVTAFGKTGYVCDDKFGLNDANVVCKELGYSLGASEVKGNSFFAKAGRNDTPLYMMDDVTCSGNETRLLDCDFSGWGVHNCQGQEIAGIVCKTATDKCASDYWQCDTGQECLPLAFVCDGLLDCTDGSDEGVQHCDAPIEIRLGNGTSGNQGRVEIRYHGTWGTVCDDDFNEDAAKVICRQLGYKGSAVVRKDSYFGPGRGPIWLDQVFCSGNETALEDCSHWNWGEHNCDHSEDVGVICSNTNDYEERHSHSRLVTEAWKPLEYPERCGYRSDSIFNRDDDVHFRVVKGSLAKKGDYPWQAAIRVKAKTSTSHWCGAVIISEKFVLTAAHCLIGYAKGAYIIAAGDYNVDEDEGTEQEAHIEDYYLHEDFRRGHKMNNDIALVKLKGRGFSFNDHVQPICLPDADTSYETSQNCTISGFGSMESGKSAFSHNLRAGWIPLQKSEICRMPHVYGDALTEGMICAGSLDEGIDSCDGDSGGPLACLYRGVFTLYGITSWGQRCGYANKPGVYVKVAHYRQWIDDTFKKYS